MPTKWASCGVEEPLLLLLCTWLRGEFLPRPSGWDGDGFYPSTHSPAEAPTHSMFRL